MAGTNPNPTAQQRQDWEQIKVSNRAGAERAPMNTRTGGLADLIERVQRENRDRANDKPRDRDDDRSR